MDEKHEQVTAQAAAPDAPALARAQEESALWQTRAAYLQAQAQRADEARATLSDKVMTLESQLCALEAHAADVQTRLAQTQALLDSAQTTAAMRPRLAAAAPRPPIVDLVDQLPRSTDRANQFPRRTLAQIRQLVLHHTGSADLTATPQQLAEFHVHDPKHQWPGIGFHFFIAADGAIYQTNRLEAACFHVALNNATAVGIVVVGQFDASGPATAQVTSAAALLAWLLQELHLPVDSIIGHSEFPDQHTDCPGTSWRAAGGWKETVIQQVLQASQTPRRALYHYVLFWQTDAAWAEADWQAATRYIARFRPTAGFSAQEASQAENVTIIGGPAGVPVASEEMLRAAGCRVQRIAGKTGRETRAMLDGMASSGQRFLPT